MRLSMVCCAIVAVAATVHVWFDAGDSSSTAAGRPATSPATLTRHGAGVEIDLPRQWQRVPGDAGTATWRSTDGMHVVTVAATEYGATSLRDVAGGVARLVARQPGVRQSSAPRSIALDSAPHDDRALYVGFTVAGAAQRARSEVVQVWRRDSRAGSDLVATWTSADGSWPVDPRKSLPSADAR